MNQPVNPYAAPITDASVAVDPVSLGVKPASQNARFVNLIVDSLVQYAITSALVMLILAVGGEASSDFFASAGGTVFGWSAMILYYFIMEKVFGKTVGKMVTGTRVVNETGGVPSTGQILGRTFCRLIPFEAFSFLGKTARGWHDRIPGTYVIKDRGNN